MATYTNYGNPVTINGLTFQPSVTYEVTLSNNKHARIISNIRLWFRVRGTANYDSTAGAILRIAKSDSGVLPLSGSFKVQQDSYFGGAASRKTTTLSYLSAYSKLFIPQGSTYADWTVVSAAFSSNSLVSTIMTSTTFGETDNVYFATDIDLDSHISTKWPVKGTSVYYMDESLADTEARHWCGIPSYLSTYSVNFDGNSGSSIAGQIKMYGFSLTLTSDKPTRTGYTFKNWNTQANGSGTSYTSGGTYANNASVRLYAQWEPNTYKVTYNANGGTNAPASQTKIYGQSLTLSTAKPKRSNCTFVRWNTNSSGTGTNYASGASYTSNAAVTLYAVWVPDPLISSLTAVRCDSDGILNNEGTYCKVVCKWSLDASVNSNINSASLSGKYNAKGSSTTTNFSFSTGGSGSGNKTAEAIFGTVDLDKQYEITVTLQYTSSSFMSKTTTRSVVLTTAAFVMDFKAGGTAIGIGQAAPSSGLGIGWPVYLNNNLTLSAKNMYLDSSNIDPTTPPASGSVWGNSKFYFRDKNGDSVGQISPVSTSGGRVGIVLWTQRADNSGTNGLYLYSDSNGDPYVAFSTGAQSAWFQALSYPLILGSGNEIEAASDLDDITDPGVYKCSSSSTAAGLTNCPVDVAFRLEVFNTLGNQYKMMRLYPYNNSGIVWQRRYYNGSWYSWVRCAPWTQDSQAANKFLASPDGSTGQPSYRSIVADDLPTIPATKGGTGQASLANSEKALINSLGTETATLTGSEYLIVNKVGTTDTWVRRSLNAVWNWLLSKIEDIIYTRTDYDVKSLITVNNSGNFAISSANLYVCGMVAQLRVVFTIENNLTAGTEYAIGSLNTSIRPVAQCDGGVGDRRVFATISGGTMYIRPEVAMSSGTTTYSFCSTYILNTKYPA